MLLKKYKVDAAHPMCEYPKGQTNNIRMINIILTPKLVNNSCILMKYILFG